MIENESKQAISPRWKRPLVRWGVAGALILFGAFSYWYSLKHPDTPQAPKQAAQTSTSTTSDQVKTQPKDVRAVPNTGHPASPTTTVESSGGFKLTSKSAFSCTAEAPADWTMSSNKESNSADLASPDKKLYAGYGIQAVNEAIAPYASAYSAPLNDPDLYSSDPPTMAKAYAKVAIAGLGGSTDVQFTSDYNQTIGDYTLRSIASSTHKGVIFFLTTGIAGDGVNYSYIEPVYFGITTNDSWDNEGLLVAQVASGIKCNAQLVQHDGPVVKARTSSGLSNSADTNDTDAGYNPQLGTEEVHNSATGENYLVSPSTNWSSDGPQGAGYYTVNGNDYVKLEAGRSN